MKKSWVVVSFALILIIFLSVFVSAGFFSDIWGKITGEVTYYSTCTDADRIYPGQSGYTSATFLGDNPYKQGTFDGLTDSCSVNMLTEYYCEENWDGNYFSTSKQYYCDSADFGRTCIGGACVLEGTASCPYVISREVDGSETCRFSASYDNACCFRATDCVANGVCYASDATYTNSLCQSATSGEYCYKGKWYNEKSSLPKTICDADFPTFTWLYRIVDPSEISYPTYEGDTGCCARDTDCVAHDYCYAEGYHQLPGALSRDENSGELCSDNIWYDEATDAIWCGNGLCQTGETYINCLVDCSALACTTSTQCDEFECKIGSCNVGTCSYPNNDPDGTSCTGGVCCKGSCCIGGNICCGEVCRAAECSSVTDCDDGDACTTDTCSSDGTCTASCDNVDIANCGASPTCGDGNVDDGEECDDGNSNSDDTIDACRTDCKDFFCGDDVCDTDEPSSITHCSADCGPYYQYIDTCQDCVGIKAGYTWCKNLGTLGKCVAYPRVEGCTNMANYDYECKAKCVHQMQEYLTEELGADLEVKSLLTAIVSRCGLNFEFDILTSLPTSYTQIPNKRIIKILNITSNADAVETYVIDFILNESELDLKFPIGNVTIYIEEDNEWLLPTEEELKRVQTNIYTYRFRTTHFSLFLITEPELCGNDVFDTGFEDCDGSVTEVTNCTACVCDTGYDEDGSGGCTEDITGIKCSEEGDEDCKGYTFYECDDDLEWDKKGKVIGECSVECSPIGNMSCQGEIPIRCASDYQWDLQSRISGLCGYVSTNPLGYNTTGDRCGNGYCNYDEDESSCPEDCEEEDDDAEPNWGLIALVAGIAILILILVIVLFKIFSKERRGGMPPPNRRLPPEHRPGPKREPGRPLEHNLPVGRPAVGQGNYPRRRYPSR